MVRSLLLDQYSFVLFPLVPVYFSHILFIFIHFFSSSEIAAENRTIFAPNADAFASISPDLTAQIVNDESLVGVILKHHIVDGVWSKASLTDGLELTAIDGEILTIRISGDSVKVEDSDIVETDFLATNGVSHVISSILLPSTLVNDTETGTAFPVAPPTPGSPPVEPPAPGSAPVATPSSNAVILGSAFSVFVSAVLALF